MYSATPRQEDIALKVDTALATIEKNNKALAGALPDNYFSRLGLDTAKLGSLIDSIDDIDTVADRETDVVGRVYEYFLGKFAAVEGKGGGEFYVRCLDAAANYRNGLALQKYRPDDETDYLPVLKIAQLRTGRPTHAEKLRLIYLKAASCTTATLFSRGLDL